MNHLAVLAGSANPPLAAAVARELGLTPAACTIERFPDGEIHVEVEPRDVEGRDVAVVQPTGIGRGDLVLELLLVADACRRSGARSVSAAIPYFAYARQDRRKRPGEPLGARVVADVLGTARLERIVAVDLHSDVVEASLAVPVDALTAVPLLAAELGRSSARDAVIVAPDFGAARLAREYARLLRLPVAVVHKVRSSATHVDVERIAGDVRGLRPILVDDMVATGATIVAAARALEAGGAQRGVVVAATHAVLTQGAMERMREAGLSRLVVTDTIALASVDPTTTVVSVAALLASAVGRVRVRR